MIAERHGKIYPSALFYRTADRIDSKNGGVQVTLPNGWETAQVRPGTNKISGVCAEKDAYFLVIAGAKSDFTDNQTVKDYAATILKIEEKKAVAQNVTLTKLRELTVHGYPAVQYGMTGTVLNVKLVYVKTFVAMPTRFAQVLCWSTPSRVKESYDDFDAIIESIVEPKEDALNPIK